MPSKHVTIRGKGCGNRGKRRDKTWGGVARDVARRGKPWQDVAGRGKGRGKTW